MQAYILLGSRVAQEEYISFTVKKYKIAPYNLVSFDEGFKIADARRLTKTASIKLGDAEKRLVTIKEINPEAQNALLKTIEELPISTFVFFLPNSKDDLLPTIISRSSIVYLEKKERVVSSELEEKIKVYLNFSNEEAQKMWLELIDSLGVSLELSNIEEVVFAVRKVLLSSLENSKNTANAFLLLKNLDKYYRLAKSNNINKKMALENVGMTS